MAKRVAALHYDGQGRILLRRTEGGGEWQLPAVEVDPDEEPWDAAPRAIALLGYQAMALRLIDETDETEYWLTAARSGAYADPGDFFDIDELPPLADDSEAGPIRAGK